MRAAAGQLADRVHLADLQQFLLERLAVGHVEQGARKLRGPAAARGEQDGLVEEVLVLPVGAEPAILDRHRARPLPRLQRREGPLGIVGMEPVGP